MILLHQFNHSCFVLGMKGFQCQTKCFFLCLINSDNGFWNRPDMQILIINGFESWLRQNRKAISF